MGELYYFNPYYPFVEREGASSLLLSSDRLMIIPDNAVRCTQAIVKGTPITISELVDELGNHSARVLLENHVVIDDNIRGEDMFSRTRGLLSLSGHESDLTALDRATVLLLGAGAIGSHVGWTLTAYGVGHLVILDDDSVEASNLNRQLLYTQADIGRRKVEALSFRLREIRPDLRVTTLDERLTSTEQMRLLLAQHHPDAVVKALDTPEEVTSWINTACVEARVPYTTGGFVQLDAIVGPTYVPGRTPCLDCFEQPEVQTRRICGIGGTCSTATSFAASLVADEIVRALTGKNPVEAGRMTVRHATDGLIEHQHLNLVPRCGTCGARHRRQHQSPWRTVVAGIWGMSLCALPFLITLPSWTVVKTLWCWALCAGFTPLLPQRNRGVLVAAVAVVYSTLSFAMTLRFNPQILGIGGELPVIMTLARVVVGYVITVSLGAMIMVALTAVVQALAALPARLWFRFRDPGYQEAAA